LISLEEERLIYKDIARVEVHTFPDSSNICLQNDSCIKAPLVLEVPRSGNDIKLLVKSDSLEKTVTLKSKVLKTYDIGHLYFVHNCPSKKGIDNSTSNLILGYDNPIFIDLINESSDYKKWRSSKKGQLYVRASFPWFNYVGFDNGLGFENYVTYMGMTLGVDYYHSKRSYYSLIGGATGISDLAFPVMDSEYDTAEFVKTYCIKLTNSHDFNLFSNEKIVFTIGYGLNFTHFTYKIHDDVNNVELYKNTKSVIGLSVDANLLLFRYGFFGINYSPSFYTLTTNKWEYSFLTYIDFGVKIPLGNYRKIEYRVLKYDP
jgi:hypothetical protein